MFWKNFVDLCVKNSTSPNAVAKELSIASGAVTKWKNGSVPHQTTLTKIATYFNVTVEELISEQKETPPEEIPAGLDEQDIEILNLYSRLSDEQKAQALTYLEFLKSQNSSKTQ
jgi:transcriptional regulator with XRE-family HTH domain